MISHDHGINNHSIKRTFFIPAEIALSAIALPTKLACSIFVIFLLAMSFSNDEAEHIVVPLTSLLNWHKSPCCF